MNSHKNTALELGQVETPLNIAQSLTGLLPSDYDYFTDIGAGLGNLSSSLTYIDGLLIELDKERFKVLQATSKKHNNVLLTDFLDPSFQLKEYIKSQKKTLYLSNPPFHRKKLDYTFNFFEDLNTQSKFQQLDIAFLDKVLSSMNNQSSIMFIISSPLIAFEKYQKERKKLIDSFDYLQVISLDDDIYSDVEVTSYVIIAHKTTSKNNLNKIMLEKMSSAGVITEQIEIKKNEGYKSLCFDFHQKLRIIKSQIGNRFRRLGDLQISLTRGSRSKREFRKLLLEPIHTTDLKKPFLFLEDSKHKIFDENKYHIAKAGDILITRVGKRALMRESMIKEGSQIFTDSVYRISCASQIENKIVWNALSSEAGRLWRDIHAQGKCAKYLTRQAILNLPI